MAIFSLKNDRIGALTRKLGHICDIFCRFTLLHSTFSLVNISSQSASHTVNIKNTKTHTNNVQVVSVRRGRI